MTIKNDLLTIKQGFNMDGYNLKELYKNDKIKLKTEYKNKQKSKKTTAMAYTTPKIGQKSKYKFGGLRKL